MKRYHSSVFLWTSSRARRESEPYHDKKLCSFTLEQKNVRECEKNLCASKIILSNQCIVHGNFVPIQCGRPNLRAHVVPWFFKDVPVYLREPLRTRPLTQGLPAKHHDYRYYQQTAYSCRTRFASLRSSDMLEQPPPG